MTDTKTTTPDAAGQVEGADGQTDGDDDTAGDDDDDGDTSSQVVFDSQQDLNDLIEKRLRQDRRSRKRKGAVDKGVKKAEDTVAAEDARADAAVDARVEKAQRLAVNASALVAATDAGLSGARAKAAARLADIDLAEVIDDDGEVDEDAVTDAIEAALEAYDFLKVEAEDTTPDLKPKPKRAGGKTPKPGDGDKKTGAVTPEEFEAMSYGERVQLYNRDTELYNQLSGN